MPTACQFADASVLLHEFVARLEDGFRQLPKTPAEFYQNGRENLTRLWEEWPARKAAFRAAVNRLPGELRKRDFMKNALKDMERYEESAKAFFISLRAEAAKSSLAPHLDAIGRQTRALSLSLDELRANPLTQKFLRGEPVLGARNKIQWGRKIGHMLCGLTFLSVFELAPLAPSLKWGFFTVFMTFCFSLEIWRHRDPKVNAWVCRVFRPVMREGEVNKINSGIFFMASMSFVYFTCPRDVAVLTMLFIAVGDPVAGIVGSLFGRHKISQHASWEGLGACFASCALLTLVAVTALFTHYHLTPGAVALFSVYGGAVGAFAESSFKSLDDNLVMPMLSAPLLWLFLYLV